MEQDGDALLTQSPSAQIGHEDDRATSKAADATQDQLFRKEDKHPLLPKHHVLEPLELEAGGPPLGTKGTDLLEDGTASISSGVFHLSTTIVGAGIMALPATMKVLGLPLGLLIILTIGGLTAYSIHLLLKYSLQRKCWTYSDLLEDAYPRVGRLALQIAVIINNTGILVVYLIIVADVLSGSGKGPEHHTGLLEEWAGGPRWWNGRAVVVLVTLITALGPLCCLRHIDSLHYTSAAAFGLAVVFVVILIIVTLIRLAEGSIGFPQMLPAFATPHDWLQLCSVVPVMANAFVCHFNVHPIYVELRNRSETRMAHVVRSSIGMCTAVYLLTASFGFLLFGGAIQGDVLANFDTDLSIPFSNVVNDVVRVSYALHLLGVFPLIHFAFREVVDAMIFPSAPPLAHSPVRFYGITAALLTLTFIGSAFVPNIWVAFEFTGATAAVSLGFTFPALIAWRWGAKLAGSMERYLVLTMISIGVLVTVTGTLSNIIKLSTGQL